MRIYGTGYKVKSMRAHKWTYTCNIYKGGSSPKIASDAATALVHPSTTLTTHQWIAAKIHPAYCSNSAANHHFVYPNFHPQTLSSIAFFHCLYFSSPPSTLFTISTRSSTASNFQGRPVLYVQDIASSTVPLWTSEGLKLTPGGLPFS